VAPEKKGSLKVTFLMAYQAACRARNSTTLSINRNG